MKDLLKRTSACLCPLNLMCSSLHPPQALSPYLVFFTILTILWNLVDCIYFLVHCQCTQLGYKVRREESCVVHGCIPHIQHMCVCVLVTQSCPTLQPHELQPTRILCLWNSPGKNTGVGCHFLLQRIFLTQGLNPGLLHCRQMLYHVSY